MAVEACSSKSGRSNNLIVGVMCLALAGWFAYDGWFGDYKNKELEKNDGRPTPNLIFNQYVGPIGLGMFALFNIFSLLKSSSRRLIADESQLHIDTNHVIAYDAIRHIDQRKFSKDGVFSLGYVDNGNTKEMKFSTRKYDNLDAILAELVKQTGAKPENTDTTTEQA